MCKMLGINYDGEFYYIMRKIKDNKGVKGFLVAARKKDSKYFTIGYSLCNRKDPYDKNFGVNLALNRALRPLNRKPLPIPTSIVKDCKNFVCRAEKYFAGSGSKYSMNLLFEEKSYLSKDEAD